MLWSERGVLLRSGAEAPQARAVVCSVSTTERCKASRRLRSGGGRSSGSTKAASCSSALRQSVRVCSRTTVREDQQLCRWASGRTTWSGSLSSRRRSRSSAARYAATNRVHSRAANWCRSALSRMASWSLVPSVLSAQASVGPSSPRDSFWAATVPSCALSLSRRSTQSVVWPSSRPIALGVRPSSCASDETTWASSIAVMVRGGALAANKSRLCSTLSAEASTTTGTCCSPCSCQRRTRLNPSITSQPPAGLSTTRTGKSATAAGRERSGSTPGRSRA